MENDGHDKLEILSTEPDLESLRQEYQDAWINDGATISRIADAEDVRYTRWAGQSADGRQWQENLPEGQRATPYDGAPDTRVFLADDICNSQVDLLVSAFWSARTRANPVYATTLTAQQSAELRKVVDWIVHGALRGRLVNDVELAAQVMQTTGHAVIHVNWQRREALRLQKVDFNQLLALAQNAPPDSEIQSFTLAVLDPTLEELAAQTLAQWFPDLKPARARQVVRELREDGTAEFALPAVVENLPEICTLIPWQDIVLPPETTDLQTARVIFRKEYVTAAELEGKIREEQWDETFVEECKKTTGLKSGPYDTVQVYYDTNDNLIEIVHAYQRGVNEDGVPGIYCTIFSPHLQAGPGESLRYAKHTLIDYAHGQQPFLAVRTEVNGRRLGESRGVPEILSTQQASIKRHRDLLDVNAQLSTCPPLLKRGPRASKVPPELGPLGVINAGLQNEWTWFPPPAGKPELALQLNEQVRTESEKYFGLPNETAHPARVTARQQRLVNQWLTVWSEALWQAAVLAYQYLSPEELTDLLGRPPTLTADQVAKHRLILWFDVRAMDKDWVLEMVQAMNNFVLPTDSGGVVDRAKYVRFVMNYFEPTLAEETTMDTNAASQQVFEQVRNEVSQMALGNEAIYTENDPAAQMKLKFLQQIIGQNQKYQQLLQSDQNFKMLVEKYAANLQQSVAQEQNKMTGRLGVEPGNPG